MKVDPFELAMFAPLGPHSELRATDLLGCCRALATARRATVTD